MKPLTLSSFPPAFAFLNRAQLAAVPHPKTVRIEAGAIPRATKHPRSRKAFDATGLIRAVGISGAVTEHAFHETRKWRFDVAWPALKFAVEIDGGLFVNGGHSRGKAREGDMEKDAEAMALGWRVLRCSTGQVRSGKAAKWILAILKK